ncbi:MAG: hypothetical protein ACRC2B_04285 [Rubrivivax sp.]
MNTMRILIPMAAALLVGAGAASAAPARYLVLDHSSEALMSKAEAMAIWKAQVDDNQRLRLHKLYPVGKWGFISQVEGGFTSDMACVVTARALMVPRIRGEQLVFKPHKSATTFGTQAGATREQCRALAATKLTEAIDAVASSLIVP